MCLIRVIVEAVFRVEFPPKKMKVNLGMATELDGIVKGMRIDCDFLIKQASKQGHRGGNVEKDQLVHLGSIAGPFEPWQSFPCWPLTAV